MNIMYNPIEEKKKYVQRQIEKSFDNGINIAEEIQKAKWKVGDEKQYNGITYFVSGFNAKGTPLWKKKKDSEASNVAKNQTSANNVLKRKISKLVVRDKDGNWVNTKITYSQGDLGEKLHKLRDMGYDISKVKYKGTKLIEVG